MCRECPPHPGLQQDQLLLRTKIIVLFILYFQKKSSCVALKLRGLSWGSAGPTVWEREDFWHRSIWESPDWARVSNPCLKGDGGAQASAMETCQALGVVLEHGVVINPAAWHVLRVSHQREDTDLGSIVFRSMRQLGFEPGFCLWLC